MSVAPTARSIRLLLIKMFMIDEETPRPVTYTAKTNYIKLLKRDEKQQLT